MREKEEITKKFIEIIKGYVRDPVLLEKATAETRLIDDLRVSSARLVDIIIKCEDVFGYPVSDEEADRISTIGDVVRLVQWKIKKGN